MVPRLRSWRSSYSHARMVLKIYLVSRGLWAHVRVHVTKGEETRLLAARVLIFNRTSQESEGTRKLTERTHRVVLPSQSLPRVDLTPSAGETHELARTSTFHALECLARSCMKKVTAHCLHQAWFAPSLAGFSD